MFTWRYLTFLEEVGSEAHCPLSRAGAYGREASPISPSVSHVVPPRSFFLNPFTRCRAALHRGQRVPPTTSRPGHSRRKVV
jgi:hypothetical protein